MDIITILTGLTSGNATTILLVFAGLFLYLYLEEKKTTSKLQNKLSEIIDNYSDNQVSSNELLSKLMEVLKDIKDTRWR